MARRLPLGSHLTRKRGLFYYRRLLPGVSRREVAISLLTRSFREAEHLASQLDRSFLEALQVVSMNETAKSPPSVAEVIKAHLREQLAKHMSFRPDAPGGGDPIVGWPLPLLQETLEKVLGELQRRDPHDYKHEVDELLRLNELPDSARRMVGIGVLETRAAVFKEAILRARGGVSMFAPEEQAAATTEAPTPAPLLPPAPPPAPHAKPKASELVEPFFKRRTDIDNTRQQVMAQERATLLRFIEACGDRPIDTYGRGDMTAFMDILRRLPPTYGRSPKGKTVALAEIIAKADAAGASRLTDKTVKRHLSAISQFFQTAVDLGHLTVSAKVDMVGSHRFKANKQARTQRDMWTPEELTKLFKSPVWTGRDAIKITQPGPHIPRDAKFWLPILGLFHGARVEEFADLYRRDFGQDGDVWFLRIQETVADEANGVTARTLKTGNSTRVIPLHPELVRLGFVAYVAETAPNLNDPLFPDLAPQGKDQRRGARFTRDFGHYRKAIGVYRPGVGMHAFRHTSNTRLRDAITDTQQERHVNFLMGHASGGGEGRQRYDKGPGLKALAATLGLLAFPEVDLSHLHVMGGGARSESQGSKDTTAPRDTPKVCERDDV
jgi:integrase